MRRFFLTVAAATALAGTACSDSTGPGGSFVGSYELLTINGVSLPVTNEFGETIEGGQLELDSNGEFLDIVNYREFPGAPVRTVQFPGTWEREGTDRIRLDYDDGDVFFVRRTSSSRIVLEDNSGNEWAYRRF